MPSFRVNKRMLVTVPSGDTLHVFVPDDERDMCLTAYAACTDKVYWGGKVAGIRIFLKKATRGAVEDLIVRAWKYRASKKERAAYEAGKSGALRSQTPTANLAGKPAAKNRAKTAWKAAREPSTVDEYLAGFSPDIRTRLDKVRATILKAAPQAVEAISYRIPAYRLEGPLIYFAGFAQHVGMYPAPRTSKEFRDELAAYGGGKGTVQFPHDKALPLDLIRRIVKFRIAENLARASVRKPR